MVSCFPHSICTAWAWIARHAGDIELSEPRAFFSQLVDRWCPSVRMRITTQVAVPQIICKQKDNVRWPPGRCLRMCDEYMEQHECKERSSNFFEKESWFIPGLLSSIARFRHPTRNLLGAVT
jgi:hypothetical protein